MKYNWFEWFRFYDHLLTAEGWEDYHAYYKITAYNYFDVEEDDVTFDDEKHTILVKYAGQNYDDEIDAGRFFSLDLYVKEATEVAELKVLKYIDAELSLLFQEELKYQIPLIIGYILHILECADKSTYSYKNSLIQSLNQIILYLRKLNRDGFSTADPQPVKIETQGKEVNTISSNRVVFQINERINDIKYKCIKAIYGGLMDRGLLIRNTDEKAFADLFLGKPGDKVLWMGATNQLHYFIVNLIALGFIEEGGHWKAAINIFRNEKGAFRETDLQHTKPPKMKNRRKSVEIALETLKAALPSK